MQEQLRPDLDRERDRRPGEPARRRRSCSAARTTGPAHQIASSAELTAPARAPRLRWRSATYRRSSARFDRRPRQWRPFLLHVDVVALEVQGPLVAVHRDPHLVCRRVRLPVVAGLERAGLVPEEVADLRLPGERLGADVERGIGRPDAHHEADVLVDAALCHVFSIWLIA